MEAIRINITNELIKDLEMLVIIADIVYNKALNSLPDASQDAKYLATSYATTQRNVLKLANEPDCSNTFRYVLTLIEGIVEGYANLDDDKVTDEFLQYDSLSEKLEELIDNIKGPSIKFNEWLSEVMEYLNELLQDEKIYDAYVKAIE